MVGRHKAVLSNTAYCGGNQLTRQRILEFSLTFGPDVLNVQSRSKEVDQDMALEPLMNADGLC